MKVGDYVRIKKGIGKIIKCNSIYFILDTDKDNIAHDQDEIIKSSPNIIDLIEEGDFINGDQISMVEVSDIDGIKRAFNCEYETGCYTNEIIKSIVTKEQFESMEYKVGE